MRKKKLKCIKTKSNRELHHASVLFQCLSESLVRIYKNQSFFHTFEYTFSKYSTPKKWPTIFARCFSFSGKTPNYPHVSFVYLLAGSYFVVILHEFLYNVSVSIHICLLNCNLLKTTWGSGILAKYKFVTENECNLWKKIVNKYLKF